MWVIMCPKERIPQNFNASLPGSGAGSTVVRASAKPKGSNPSRDGILFFLPGGERLGFDLQSAWLLGDLAVLCRGPGLRSSQSGISGSLSVGVKLAHCKHK